MARANEIIQASFKKRRRLIFRVPADLEKQLNLDEKTEI